MNLLHVYSLVVAMTALLPICQSLADEQLNQNTGGLDNTYPTLFEVDLDVDSDNSNGFAFEGFTQAEDETETESPGKYVVSTGQTNSDGDSVPDFADGFNLECSGQVNELAHVSADLKFVPVQVVLTKGFEPDNTKVVFHYADVSRPEISPNGIAVTGTGTAADPYIFKLNKGGMRLWKKKASERTSGREVCNQDTQQTAPWGDFIPPEARISWNDIAMETGSSIAQLYLEYVDTSPPQASGMNQISVTAYQDNVQSMDVARVRLVHVEIGVDNNRDGAIDLSALADKTTAETPYRFWLNNDHDNYGNDTYNASDDHPWTTKTPDNTVNSISSERNIEDFTRLHIRVKDNIWGLMEGDLKLALRWKPSRSTEDPGVRFFKHAEGGGGIGYLKDETIAYMCTRDGTYYGHAKGTDSCELPVAFWDSADTSSCMDWLLFDGLSAGKGELTAVVSRGGAILGESGPIFLNLLDVRKMYERWKITDDATIPDPDNLTTAPVSGVTSVKDNNGNPFESAWDEDVVHPNYVVYVHGWRKSYYKARSDEITVFKRLWQKGFKGRYIGFVWPTYDVEVFKSDGSLNSYQSAKQSKYNHSEYRAWKCGTAFKTLVDGLPEGYTRNIVAHSMGNVVVGSALEQGMYIDNHVLLNAAIPAQCYDMNSLRRTILISDLCDDAQQSIRQLSYRGDVASIGHARLEDVSGFLSNFYLPSDAALDAFHWELNQSVLKPVSGYFYYPAVDVRFLQNGSSRIVSDPHESMAMVNQSISQATGRSAITGKIQANLCLNDPGMAFDSEHEAEFKWRLSKTWAFYGHLLSALELEGYVIP